jgi:uncharacterized protein
MNQDTRLKITENFLAVERDGDELVLTDYINLRPLYAKKGRTYIKRFLEAVSELRTRRHLLETFPHDADLLDTLLNHGIIVPYSFKRPKLQNYAPDGPGFHHKAGMSLYLLVSQSCNMSCIYCLNGKRTYQGDSALRMEREIAFKSVERCLEDIAPKGRLEVVFFGGEPLLNWPLVKDTVIYCENSLKKKNAEKEIRYHVTSNLSLLPPDLIEWAKRFEITFLCNIDGPADIHDICRPFKDGRPSHERTVAHVRQLLDAGLRVDLRATITALNQHRLLEISRHHKAIGGNSSAFVPVNPVNSDEDILDQKLLPSPREMARSVINVYKSGVWPTGDLYPFSQYAPRLRPGAMTVLGCGLPFGNTPVVDVKGDVYPCIYLVGIKRFYVGNVKDGSYPDGQLLKRLYDRLHVDRMEDCRSCQWRYICGGGCPLWRLTVSDNPAVTMGTMDYCKGIGCEYTRQIFEVLLWDMACESASRLLKSIPDHEAAGANAVICR